VITVVDPDSTRAALSAGTLACPESGCAGTLRIWSPARTRRVQLPGGKWRRLRPDRARCRPCGVTHVLLPAWCLPRRAYSTDVVGAALLAAAQGAGCARAAAPPPPDSPPEKWDTTFTSSTTWDGIYAPTRYGSGKLGYSKACWEHNLCNLNAFAAAYRGYCKEPSGTRCVYIAYVLYNGNPKIAIRVILERARTSQFGTTSDNRAVGTLTAYCVGSSRCPAYVNDAT
jgi:hypothetical protein